jgi:hypothetical protein
MAGLLSRMHRLVEACAKAIGKDEIERWRPAAGTPARPKRTTPGSCLSRRGEHRSSDTDHPTRQKRLPPLPTRSGAWGEPPAPDLLPVIKRLSRNATRSRNSIAAACRARTSSGGAGASSHRARASSPARVRAVHSSSKIEPRPKRSRSRAQGCDGSRKRSPVTPVPAQVPSSRASPLLVKQDGARALCHGALQPPMHRRRKRQRP